MKELFDQIISSPYLLLAAGGLALFGNKLPWAKIWAALKSILGGLFTSSTPAVAPVVVEPDGSPSTTSVSDAVGHYVALRQYLTVVTNGRATAGAEAQKALQSVWPFLEPTEKGGAS